MDKIGIITLQGLYNYGNRLQNYAVQEIIKKYGYEVESILLKGTINKRVKEAISFFSEARKANIVRYFARFYNFWTFNRKYVNLKYFESNNTLLDKIAKRYTYLALGGDQIWNQKYEIFGEFDSLGFQFGSAIAAERRIPFSPSFGESSIPEDKKEYCRHWLNEMSHLAIREKSGADIIYDLTGREAEVVIDPVMVLSESDWKKVFDEGKYRNRKYVLTCFLGGSNEERNCTIQKIAKGRAIKGVGRYEDNCSECGPADFLSMIYNAEVVCTDSFHCAAFAILFKKPFVVFDRMNCDIKQMTRLWNLLELFKLTERHESNVNFSTCEYVNFQPVDEILQEERLRYHRFLRNWFKDKIGE